MKHKTQFIPIRAGVIACLLLAFFVTDTKASITSYKSAVSSFYALRIGDSVPKPASERAEALTNSMNCEIGLLGTQVPKIYAINLEACLKMDTAALQSKDNLALYRAKGKAIDQERNVKLRDVLTPKQFAQYEKIANGNRHTLKKTAVCRDLSQTW